MDIVEENFNNFLRIGLLAAVILIGAGSILNFVANYFYINEISSFCLILIKSGIMVLICLQIFRVVYVAILFMYTKKLGLSLMSWFVVFVLTISIFFSYFPIY